MIPGRQSVIRIARIIGLLPLIDVFRFRLMSFRSRKRRSVFLAANPSVELPPDAMIYETVGKLDYDTYYHDGRQTAAYLIDIFRRHCSLDGAAICEWGCGPARLLRHMGDLLAGGDVSLYGTDYNRALIDWAAAHFPDIRFVTNNLQPPLPFDDASFDVIYSISVMTHLSGKLQKVWMHECLRVLKPGGVCLLTVHGDSFAGNLLPDELRQYREQGILVRGHIGEGRKNYSAFNSPSYMRDVLLKGSAILEHIPGQAAREQDMWIVRK